MIDRLLRLKNFNVDGQVHESPSDSPIAQPCNCLWDSSSCERCVTFGVDDPLASQLSPEAEHCFFQ